MAIKPHIGSGTRPTDKRYLFVGIVIALAFAASYAFASARSASGAAQAVAGTAGGTQYAGANGASAAGGAGGAGCACCGGSSGPQRIVKGKATISGGVQRVSVDLTTGSYSPNEIAVKAGVPLEIDFKGPASGCNGQVVFQDFGINQDVSSGGTVKVPALKPGSYKWSCGMQMYWATIIAK